MPSAANCLLKRLVPFTVAAMFIPVPLLAAEIDVPLDNVMTITLARPAKTVYIGNPSVADITVLDARHVFILGKGFGSTNLVALDAAGRETMNDQVVVTDRLSSEITVQRGVARMTMTCTPEHCEHAPQPGDDATDTKQTTIVPTYNTLTGQAEKHSDTMIKGGGK